MDSSSLPVVDPSVSKSKSNSTISVRNITTLPYSFIQLFYQYFRSLFANLLDMGNNWGSSNSNPEGSSPPENPSSSIPIDSTEHSDDIQQPKIFGNLPNPYPITRIAPELLIYSESGSDYVTIDSSTSHADAVELLNLDGVDRFVVITHGFLSTKENDWLHELKEAILQCDTRIKQTVAILGWGNGADIGLLWYNQAASNCLETGRWLGGFLAALREAHPDLATYGVGHSLGAHLMGVAGRTSQALDRITGLDPAGPGFQDKNIDKRLNRLDAKLVDVMHTDGRDVPYFGTLVPLGLIDFYPNYGWNQPTTDRSRTLKPDLKTDSHHHKIAEHSPYGGYISESHGRAIDYFTFSVRNNRAFRTNLHLDGEPAVETAVHRVASTEKGRDAGEEILVEMGYYCDWFIDQQILRQQMLSDHDDEYNRFEPFEGCYYVHTNGTAPWC